MKTRYLSTTLFVALSLLFFSSCGGGGGEGSSSAIQPGSESNSITAGTDGGTFVFPNGVVLDIPPGAVSESVVITVDDLSADQIVQIDDILSSDIGALLDKRYIGGFSVKPDLEFQVPIRATVPILPLNPNEIPLQMEIDFNIQKYWITKTNLRFLADEQTTQLEISHFSDIVITAINGISPKRLDDLCTDPLFNRILQICEDYDDLQPAYCLLKPEQRPPDAVCCREKSFHVEAQARDFIINKATGECQILSDNVVVTYLECKLPDGRLALPEVNSMCEISPNCPEGTIVEVLGPPAVDIVMPEASCFAKGETLMLEAIIKGKECNEWPLQGTVAWKSLNEGVATVDNTGLITAKAGGLVTIEASYEENGEVYTDSASVQVLDLDGSWQITEVADERACDEGINTYDLAAELVHTGDVVSFVFPGGHASGTKTGCTISGYSGEFEDAGFTYGDGTVIIAPDGKTITGSASWGWSDGEFSCSGTSELTAQR